jgi:hypothetical protein
MIALVIGPLILAAIYWAFTLYREEVGVIAMGISLVASLVAMLAVLIVPPLLLLLFVCRVIGQMRRARSAKKLRDRLREADQNEIPK